MPDSDAVKPGDVTRRVGVEVIRARGVDVDKLIKMLVANGVAGLSYDKVSVILVPVESHMAAARADSAR